MQTIPRARFPKILQIFRWAIDPVGYMQKNFSRCGDVFQSPVSWNSPEQYHLLSRPEDIQYMLTHDTGRELSAPGELNNIFESLIGRQNVILLSGKQHKKRRQLIMPPFHREHLEKYNQAIQEITYRDIAGWWVGDSLDERTAMQRITLQVILKVVFGFHQGKRYQKLKQLLSLRLNMSSTPLTSLIIFFPWLQKDIGDWSIGGRIRQLAEETDELLFAEIEERRASAHAGRMDILSLLIAAKDEEGNHLSNQDLRDELLTLIVAGHETTATALTWAMYWIHALPEVKQKLLSELEAFSESVDAGKLLKLPYLTAVCNETLRIHPVAMLTFPRRVEVPLELSGYQFSPGDLLVGCIYLLHQREDLYAQPQQFRPERFLERQFSPYEFMPFGGGVRRCIGTALAQCEMKIVLGTILSNMQLSLTSACPVEPARRGVTLGQNAPVRVKTIEKYIPAHR
ncbi:MAG: cytochrome P450 [Phormidesmis sp.]